MSNLCRLSTVASVFGSVCSNIYIPAQNHCSYVTPENSRREISTFRSISWTRSIKRFLRASIQTKCDSRSIARFYRQKLHQLGCCNPLRPLRPLRVPDCMRMLLGNGHIIPTWRWYFDRPLLPLRSGKHRARKSGMNHQVISKSSKSFAGSENPWISWLNIYPKKPIQKPSCRIASVGARCIVVVDFASAPRALWCFFEADQKKIPERSDFIVTSPKIVQPWNLLVSKVSHSCAILVTGF